MDKTGQFVSRAGQKLEFALANFKIDVADKICADLGCSTGGFTDCLLQRGAKRVYAVDTGYGVLDWKLRNDSRVIVMERTNAMHVGLPELVDLVTIDTSWTKLKLVVPVAKNLLKPGGEIIALLKPHYEAKRDELIKGRVRDDETLGQILARVKNDLQSLGVGVLTEAESPVLGEKGGNKEFLLRLQP